MRFIDRTTVNPTSKWLKRSETATKKALKLKEKDPKTSDIYGAPELRRSLLKLFCDKCAYCELSLAGGYDVEHFRPTRRPAEAPKKHPGYYWLTYKWANLYASCIACNQKRIDADLPDEGAQGKLNHFPMLEGQEGTRAWKPEDPIVNEKRALLDPCADRPEEHLMLLPSGKLEARNDSPQADATIQILHLNGRLRREHREFFIEALEKAHEDNNQQRIDRLLNERSPYSGLLSDYYQNTLVRRPS